MGFLSNVYDAVELGHFEWPFRNRQVDHPTHPATVHFPLTFLTAAYTADTIFGLASRYPTALAAVHPFLGTISQFAYLSHVLGAVTSLPALTSGSAELWELHRSGGINRRDKELTNPRSAGDIVDRSVRIGVVHGALNTLALGVSAFAIYSRTRTPGFTPGRAGILLSALTLPGVAVSAALGGELVYGKGVGVQRMGNARDEKVVGIKENQEINKVA